MRKIWCFFFPHLFIYSIIYVDMDSYIYFILLAIIQYHIIYFAAQIVLDLTIGKYLGLAPMSL